MTCSEAISALPADIAGPVRGILSGPATESAKVSAITLALGLETSASQAGIDPTTRTASLTAAKCLRDWSATASMTPVTTPAVPALPSMPTVIPPPPPAKVPSSSLPKLSAPMLYGDANGVEWLVTQEAPMRWVAMLNQAPPSGAYASGLPFLRETREAIVNAIDERAAVAGGA